MGSNWFKLPTTDKCAVSHSAAKTSCMDPLNELRCWVARLWAWAANSRYEVHLVLYHNLITMWMSCKHTSFTPVLHQLYTSVQIWQWNGSSNTYLLIFFCLSRTVQPKKILAWICENKVKVPKTFVGEWLQETVGSETTVHLVNPTLLNWNFPFYFTVVFFCKVILKNCTAWQMKAAKKQTNIDEPTTNQRANYGKQFFFLIKLHLFYTNY